MSGQHVQNTVVVHGMAGDGPLRIFGDGASIAAPVGASAGTGAASGTGASLNTDVGSSASIVGGIRPAVSVAAAQVLTSIRLVATVVSVKKVEDQPHFPIVPAASATVPEWGETLLLLVLSRKLRMTVPGDLEEDFRADIVKWGLRRARYLYWREVARYAGKFLSSTLRYGVVAWISHRLSP